MVAGPSGSGKTSLITRHCTGKCPREHVLTQGKSVRPLRFNTTRGVIQFDMWDTACKGALRGLDAGYYIRADGVLFVTSSDITPAEVDLEVVQLKNRLHSSRVNLERVPLIHVINKADLGLDHYNVNSNIVRARYPNIVTYRTSSRSCYQFEKPFLDLARQLTGDSELEFLPLKPVTPPEVSFDNMEEIYNSIVDSKAELEEVAPVEIEEIEKIEEIEEIEQTPMLPSIEQMMHTRPLSMTSPISAKL